MKRQAIALTDPREGGSTENLDLVSTLLYDGGCMPALLDDAAQFSSEEEMKQTWQANRELLMGLVTEDPLKTDLALMPGQRAWGYWRFESDIPPKVLENPEAFTTYRYQDWQLAWLRKHGQLLPGEAEAVVRVKARIAELQRLLWRGKDLPSDDDSM
ncbi:MAG TPA: hypothetical protein VMY35_16090 [Phycisphaerae bacterium]|nr:hypothetical protein [Phycisphaerae bacterium]